MTALLASSTYGGQLRQGRLPGCRVAWEGGQRPTERGAWDRRRLDVSVRCCCASASAVTGSADVACSRRSGTGAPWSLFPLGRAVSGVCPHRPATSPIGLPPSAQCQLSGPAQCSTDSCCWLVSSSGLYLRPRGFTALNYQKIARTRVCDARRT